MYGYRLPCCLADSLAHQPFAGTGTVMRPDTLREHGLHAGTAGWTCSTCRTTSIASLLRLNRTWPASQCPAARWRRVVGARGRQRSGVQISSAPLAG